MSNESFEIIEIVIKLSGLSVDATPRKKRSSMRLNTMKVVNYVESERRKPPEYFGEKRLDARKNATRIVTQNNQRKHFTAY